MKVALVHDWLHGTYGGAERVLLQFSKIFPEADIYTLMYEQKRFQELLGEHGVQTSFLQSLPDKILQNRKYLLPLVRTAVEEWNFDDYDLVLSSSSSFVKNITTPNTLHVCYCHTPARFLWDYEKDYYKNLNKSAITKYIARKFSNRLKQWDKDSKNVDHFIANSETVAGRIKEYYDRESTVINPPVEIEQISPEPQKEDYYLTLSTLTAYKKIDLVIRAFNQTQKKLVVVGEGPERSKLEKIAHDNIAFTGFVSDKKKIQLLQKSRGLIFPNEEDFGIAPVEALAAGTPVIGYNKGGVTETVVDGKTGVLFSQQNESELLKAIKKAERQHFSAESLHRSAQEYSVQDFNKKIKSYIQHVRQ